MASFVHKGHLAHVGFASLHVESHLECLLGCVVDGIAMTCLALVTPMHNSGLTKVVAAKDWDNLAEGQPAQAQWTDVTTNKLGLPHHMACPVHCILNPHKYQLFASDSGGQVFGAPLVWEVLCYPHPWHLKLH